jgi:Protein of unknown function (DUF2934)
LKQTGKPAKIFGPAASRPILTFPLAMYFNGARRSLRRRRREGKPFASQTRRLAMGRTECEVRQEEIARRAYEIWEARGRPTGDGSEDWDAAVAELTSRRGVGLRHWWERMRRSIVGGDS